MKCSRCTGNIDDWVREYGERVVPALTFPSPIHDNEVVRVSVAFDIRHFSDTFLCGRCALLALTIARDAVFKEVAGFGQ